MNDYPDKILLVRIQIVGLLFAFLLGLECSDHPHESGRIRDSLPGPLLSGQSLAALKDSLLRQGLYQCCTEPGCTHCVNVHRECSCYDNIRKSDPICGECLDGYKAGEGKLKLVSIPELEQIREKKGSP